MYDMYFTHWEHSYTDKRSAKSWLISKDFPNQTLDSESAWLVSLNEHKLSSFHPD